MKNKTRQPRPKLSLAITIFGMLLAVMISSFVQQRKRIALREEILKTLGITPRQAQDYIWKSASGNYLSYGGNLQALRGMNGEERTAAALEMLHFIREYTASSEFAERYEAFRDEKKPQAPLTVEQELKKQTEGAQQGYDNMKKSLSTASADMKATIEETMAMFKEQVRLYSDPKHPDHQSYRDMMEMGYTQSKKQYEDNILAWQKEYPAAPAPYLKKKLEKFLAITDEVDYGAELKPGNGGKKVFVNPAYEKKPAEWKKCFRAGKEAGTAFRKALVSWKEAI